jgi:hypothetical protein
MTMDASRDHGQKQSPPPPRDRLPTLPEDLSEYAWLHTGPESWSAQRVSAEVIELADDDVEDCPDDDDDDDAFFVATAIEPDELDRHINSGIDEITAGLLIDLWHSDIPQLASERTALIDEREAYVVSLMDGIATVSTVLETSGLPVTDVLGVFCELCARGVVTLDRSRRVATTSAVEHVRK